MIKILKLNAALFSVFFFVSISKLNAQTQAGNVLQTKSGLTYKVIPGNDGAKPQQGEFAKFQLKYTAGAKDSVLHSSFNTIPDYIPVDTSAQAQYSFMEIIPKMAEGDSAYIVVSVDSLVNKKMIPAYNETFKEGSNIKCQVKLLKVFSSDSAVKEDYQKETELEKNREIKNIEAYMTKTGLKGVKTKSGAYVVLETPGDATLKADSGKVASIKYKGYLFNGSVFDTNMDSTKGHTEPIQVNVGKGEVIKGWDECLPYFGKGGKGKVFVPAMLGYGPQPMGNEIPAYSNLIFDIEIADVTAQP
jgi:FKBP-type peptidyl-prolyl cis-trans isomerase FkpA